MKKEALENILNTIKNGTFVRIGYTTEVPLRAKFKNSNITIKKIVITTGRLGVNYKNISKVTTNTQTSNINRVNNYIWVLKNKLKFNTNTNKYYLPVATIPTGSNTQVQYVIFENENKTCVNSKEQLKKYSEYIIPSYFTKNTNTPIFSVNIDNIWKVGNHIE